MKYTVISVPDMNDSVSRLVLNKKEYRIRFTWNDTASYWTFGISDSLNSPIIEGIKIVPQFPLNLFNDREEAPNGLFVATTDNDKIGRKDFIDGKAQFLFIPKNN